MASIIYARVSDAKQDEKNLSIPAQLRLARREADHLQSEVIGEYSDVASGRTLKRRPGIISAIARAKRDPSVDMLIVHRLDRVSRNVFNHLLLKGELRRAGVALVSVVEKFDPSPMGEFLENIMAAQAEYYSANLALEVKKGLEERLLRGLWTGQIIIGYRKVGDAITLDPARAPQMLRAFELWASGRFTSRVLADEMYASGLVSRNGNKISASKWCALLKNPFYVGIMRVNGVEYPGVHPPLVSQELFDRCQEVFAQKNSGRRQTRRHLTFVLAGKVQCPRCAQVLTGEQHVKKTSGRIYRYYRCHQQSCGFSRRANELEAAVANVILQEEKKSNTFKRVVRRLKRVTKVSDDRKVERLRELHVEEQRLRRQQRDLASSYSQGLLNDASFHQQALVIKKAMEAASWLRYNATTTDEHADSRSRRLLDLAQNLEFHLCSTDVVKRKGAMDALVDRITLTTVAPVVHLKPDWHAAEGESVMTSVHTAPAVQPAQKQKTALLGTV